MNRDQIESYFDQNREQILGDISRLCRIRSVREEALPGMPFGKGNAEALAEALKMADEMGFKTKNFDGYVGTIDYNDNETELAILAHLDVVHEGKGWSVTEPYEPKVVGDRIYGRGTADDKGPAVVSLHALKALRDSGTVLAKNVRLILGCDEECGSSDLKHYFSIEKAPPKSFSPDSSYPVTNIEKGGLNTNFTASFEPSASLPRVLKVEGGTASNIVCQEAFALVEGLESSALQLAASAVQNETGVKMTLSDDNGAVRIDAYGMSAHASVPQNGKNAICALLKLLCGLDMAKSEGFDRLCSVSRLFPYGDTCGEALGVKQCDEISGELTMNLGIFSYSPSELKGNFDSRTPLCANESNMSLIVKKSMQHEGLALEKTAMRPPHHTPSGSDFVKTLNSVYEQYTGLKGGCVAIGGGTYVHDIDGGVAFGCAMESTENNMHGPDENASIPELMVSGKIFAQVILDICAK